MKPVFSEKLLQSQGYKIKLPVLNVTFLKRKNSGHLWFCYWRVSFYFNKTYTARGVQTFKSTCE